MILLLGRLDDPMIAYVCTCLLARKVDFLVIDPRHSPHQCALTWTMEQGRMHGSLCYGRQEVALADIGSIYIRQLRRPPRSQQTPPPGQDQTPQPFPLSRWLATFSENVPALVVNRPSAVSSNLSKPYQQQLIARHGFRVPRTRVTTLPAAVTRFYEECQGRVIYKSISHQRSIVRRMTPGDLSRLAQVRYCPTQFQEYIAGIDIRVHTVGERVFATEILSEATDYRYAGREGARRAIRGIELPAEVATRCLHLARGLDLMMSGIDLRRSPDGDYYCFEVNPAPAFIFYQTYTGQRIGDALADLLCQGMACRKGDR
ncbi:MAG: hypothetical protein D6736_08310 [Nitrospinota bacterium]|nr:MAG: hypothetical protein D6736_08310 [Nitrospinota bacterium]